MVAAPVLSALAIVFGSVIGQSGGALADSQPPPSMPTQHCGAIEYHHMRFPNWACLRLRYHAKGTVEMVQTAQPGALVLKLSNGRLLALNLEGNTVIRNDQGQTVTVASIATGDTVYAPYNVTGQGDVTRQLEVFVPGTTPPPPPPAPPFRVRGRIVSDNAGALVVDTARGVQEDFQVTSSTHLTARTGGALTAGDFFVGEAQKVGTTNDVLFMVYGSMPFWESRHLFTGTLTAANGTQGTLQSSGHTYALTLVHNAVVIDANGAAATIQAGDQVRVRGSLFLGTLYASFVTVTGQAPAPAGG